MAKLILCYTDDVKMALGKLQVAVRCRPLTVKEKLKSRDILRVLDDKVRLSVSLQKGTLGFRKLQQ